LSRKTREARQELRKFLTFARKINPDINGFLRYDRLFIDGDIYHYDQVTRNVELLSLGQSQNRQESFRRTLSESVPNICLSCEEDGRKSVKTLKLQKQKQKEVETVVDVNNPDNNEQEHQLTE